MKLWRNNKGVITPLERVSDYLPREKGREFIIKIFGQEVDYNTIDWHQDYKSGYTYARKRFDKVKYFLVFNQGIEVKFPWDLSRFQFGVDLALCYHTNKDEKYYRIFKDLILKWIENNPFLTGINWVCTMDIAIRAVNWLITANIFGNIFWKDEDFVKTISKSLIDHAYYIETFPEIRKDGKSNNHLISDYSGLFVLALSLVEHPHACKWLQMAVNGLEKCMQKQVLEDGTDFENSIPYHRLVIELLAVPLILKPSCFSDFYKQRLFKMFEFVSAYIDHKGNAPQIGDNDSGIYIKLSENGEQNHSYLLSLGESIFGYDFGWKDSTDYIPVFKYLKCKIEIDKTRDCCKTTCFENSGYYFLKNENITVSVFCPTTDKGHRHYDTGSFTLSYKGNPIIVDPGTGCYTSDLEIRKMLRDYPSHNLYYLKRENKHNIGCFGVKVDTFAQVNEFTDDSLRYSVTFDNGTIVERYFRLLSNMLVIEDVIIGSSDNLFCALHFYNTTEVVIEGAARISEEQYQYSPMYSILEKRKRILILPSEKLTTKIVCS
ncbi:MAG: heparinase II/III family protein [Tannerella sp.]|nr:heparinase II/III family protein [Tannerella sp.]